MNPFADIEFFTLINKLGNMATAAQTLGVTPPVVTRRLALLEKRLGVRLMHRTTRKLSLTPEGETYLMEGVRIFEEMKALEERVSGGSKQPQGTIRMAATLGFGRTHLAPCLSQFAKAYPQVDIQLHLSDKAVNLVEQGFDVMIHFGEPIDSRLTARLLAKNKRIVCAAPSYLAAHGTPIQPRDLGKHNCIFIRQADETFGTWHLSRADKTETVKVRSSLTTNDGSSGLGWALDGHGILVRSEWEIAPLLASGKLVRVLPDWSPPVADIYIVRQVSKQVLAKVRVLADYLLDIFEARRGNVKSGQSAW
jgi:DNA-binding transcriptional LysR family regulator